ncbi:acyltransferase [Massilimicrobiota timonensis]|uniref:Capsule biosynthesis protein CapG n=1 Tax=Massilimicrobiota timonensis TaxID=1776392 RepID=A0A1Y4SUM6_9FIRM|nr:acyltransferase [Massilimicrobiota timonensis]OUQ33616.1 capsule biosynthesis protein CapG [Massilimicrobiota timonensis]
MRNILIKLKYIFFSLNNYSNELRKIGVRIGENCEIYPDVFFGSEPYLITIGNHVRITSGCKFITHDGGVWVLREKYNNEKIDLFGQIQIGNNVHIGMNTIIMPGVTIGNNVIVGCGAVVTKDIPDGQIWAGVPAKFIKNIDDYYSDHIDEFDYTKKFSSQNKKEYLKRKYNIK